MVRLERINGKNVWDIIKLKVSEEQRDFVASNDLSIIEAYTALIDNGHAFPFGIYDDETPVGFLMIGYDVDDSAEDPPRIAYGNYCIWRLMIDEKQQHKGYGRQSVELALEFVRTFPCGEAEYCYLSYEPENEHAKKLYHDFGFTENGETDEEEIVAVLPLRQNNTAEGLNRVAFQSAEQPENEGACFMKFSGFLIVVKDINRARQYYQELFGLEMLVDNDGNMILSDGLVLQEKKYWRGFIGRDVIPQSNSCELYFEESDIEGFVEKLETLYPETEYVNTLMTHSWGQRVVRFYDPDGNLIEVGTPV